MVTYNTSNIKNGLKVLINNEPHVIIESEFYKPGKGQAFSKLKVKNLINGKTNEKTLKIGESLEHADIKEKEMQFLYNDNTGWIFMDNETYEQITLTESLVSDNSYWLKSEDICSILFFNNEVINISIPNFAELQVTETEPGLKGDTTSTAVKDAKLETGVTIKVPIFINISDIIKVDTRSSEYISRVRGS